MFYVNFILLFFHNVTLSFSETSVKQKQPEKLIKSLSSFDRFSKSGNCEMKGI